MGAAAGAVGASPGLPKGESATIGAEADVPRRSIVRTTIGDKSRGQRAGRSIVPIPVNDDRIQGTKFPVDVNVIPVDLFIHFDFPWPPGSGRAAPRALERMAVEKTDESAIVHMLRGSKFFTRRHLPVESGL